MATTTTSLLTFRLFGTLEITLGGEPSGGLNRLGLGRWILALLALQDDHQLARDELAEIIWPDHVDNLQTEGRGLLRRHLGNIRDALGGRDAAGQYLQSNNDRLWLLPGAVQVDLADFRHAVREGDDGQIVARYGGMLLGDCALEGLKGYIQKSQIDKRCLKDYLGARERLADLCTKAEDLAGATTHLHELIGKGPLRETYYSQLMELQWRQGDLHAALETYKGFVRKVTVPSSALSLLFYTIQDDLNERQNDYPDSVSLTERSSYPPHNIPRIADALIGRRSLIVEIRKAFAEGNLVTLTGTGGVGKTRVAVQVAADAKSRYRDGAWFVDLAPTANMGELPRQYVAQTVASALGVQPEGGRPLVDALTKHFREKSLLIVLNDCDRITEECGDFVSAVSPRCPEVHFLVTSQQPLDLEPVEQKIRVPPLSVPEIRWDNRQPFLSEDWTQIERKYGAIELFLRRARQADRIHPFELSAENAAKVAVICSRLAGIPKFLQMAAGQLEGTTLDELYRPLHDLLPTMSSGRGILEPKHHQTPQELMKWSHGLLSDREALLFARLSVFSGGWTLPAAQKVCLLEGDTVLSSDDIGKLLKRLVKKSVAEKVGGRFYLWEPLRDYAQDRLKSSSQARQLHRQHFLWCLELAAEANLENRTHDQLLWLERVRAEHKNMQNALAWSVGKRNWVDQGLRLASLLYDFWNMAAFWGEGRSWLEEALSKAERADEMQTRATALNGLGVLMIQMHDYRDARLALIKGTLAARRVDADCQAKLFNSLGYLYYSQSRLKKAEAFYQFSLGRYKEARNGPGSFWPLNGLGDIALTQNDLGAAERRYGEGLSVCEEADDMRGQAFVLEKLSRIAKRQGDLPKAYKYLRRSIKTQWNMGNLGEVAVCLERFASCAEAQLFWSECARFFGAAWAIRRSVRLAYGPNDESIYQQRTSKVRQALGDKLFSVAWNHGIQMTPEQAVAVAMSFNGDI